MSTHQLRRGSRTITGKVRGGHVYSCTSCGWQVIVGSTTQGVRAHAAHRHDVAVQAAMSARVDAELLADGVLL